MEEVRLNKALADAGLCSRRKADEHIVAGEVTVNGIIVATPGVRIIPGKDKVCFLGREVRLRSAETKDATCVLMLHKPVEVVSTVRDPQGRKTVLDFVPVQWKQRRLYPVGRLDYFSEGLILLTDDGELANRLMHPRWHLPRTYEVRVRPDHGREIPPQALQQMRDGMTLAEGETLAPVKVEVLPAKGQGVVLRMVLHQGVNRQIRRMCRDVGLTILRLIRISQGPLQLGSLPPGEVRPLTAAEQKTLRQAVSLPVAGNNINNRPRAAHGPHKRTP